MEAPSQLPPREPSPALSAPLPLPAPAQQLRGACLPKAERRSSAELHPPLAPEYQLLLDSWLRSLRADNKSARTIETYREAARYLGEYLQAQGMPQRPDRIRREHVESFMIDQLTRFSAGTAHNRYRGLQQFFRWLLEEGELKASPMANMAPPQLPEKAPPVLTDTEISALLKVCGGRDFLARRDTALIRVLLDTGLRRAELAGLKLTDMDLDQGVLFIGSATAKGRRERAVALGHKSVKALDQYLRARAKHPAAALPVLWLGHRGQMTPSGVYQIVRDRAEQAGIGHAFTHLFRHTFAHLYLANGGKEGNLMQLAGWRSRAMVDRYGRSAAGERARAEHRELGIGDRF